MDGRCMMVLLQSSVLGLPDTSTAAHVCRTRTKGLYCKPHLDEPAVGAHASCQNSGHKAT